MLASIREHGRGSGHGGKGRSHPSRPRQRQRAGPASVVWTMLSVVALPAPQSILAHHGLLTDTYMVKTGLHYASQQAQGIL